MHIAHLHLLSLHRGIPCKKIDRLTCKGDRKLFHLEDWVNPTSSDDEDGIFLNQRNFPTVFWSHTKEISGNFPSAFQQWIKIKSSTTWAQTYVLQGSNLLLYTTVSSVLCLPLSAMCLPSSVLCSPLSVLCFFGQCCVKLRQYCVKLFQYCVFLR